MSGAIPWVIVGLVLVFVVLRVLGRRRKASRSSSQNGSAALVGRPAVVIERIANGEGVGCVKIDGQVWTARSFEDQVIEPGTRVDVVEIRGATALVSE